MRSDSVYAASKRAAPLALALAVPALSGCGGGIDLADRYPVIPAPRTIEPAEGVFELGPDTRIVLSHPGHDGLRRMAEWLAEPIRISAGLPVPVVEVGDDVDVGPGAIRLRVGDPDAEVPFPAPARAERYVLEATPGGVVLEADRMPGLFRGLQTLRQLLPAHVEGGVRAASPWGLGGGRFGSGGRLDQRAPGGDTATAATPTDERPGGSPEFQGVGFAVPAVRIEDEPRFGYRGMHLDVGRHLFPVEFILEYVDLLAAYKLNAFHWHLTEDQGWRVEIEGHPRLTGVGAWRDETVVGRNFDPLVADGRRYGGYYTREEIRRVVDYARDRQITVIPEIELPGHASAAIAAYPELGCREDAPRTATRWGVFEDIYCPKEETFEFLEGVLTEVMELFPSPYIHVGGDEAPKAAWEESLVAQEIMEREGLADEHELQSWFIRRIERFLLANGRRLIGWDEILEGGLAPEATVMSWRGTAGGIEAARQGHDVIMTPTSHAYFDYYQGPPAGEPLAIGGDLPVETVYAFEPVPGELTAAEARHVLGPQGNVWTEYMPTPAHVEYMVLPRMAAMAEVGWSARERRDLDDFLERLRAHLARWRALGVNHRVPEALRR